MKLLVPMFVVLAIIVVVGTLFISASFTKTKVSDSLASGLNYLNRGFSDLKNLDAKSAEKNFVELDALSHGSELDSPFTKMWLMLKDGGTALASFQSLTSQVVLLAQELSKMSDTWTDSIFRGKGSELAGSLKKIDDVLGEVLKQKEELATENAKFKDFAPVDLSTNLPLQLDLSRIHSFLGVFIPWLMNPAQHHFCVFSERFRNASRRRFHRKLCGCHNAKR